MPINPNFESERERQRLQKENEKLRDENAKLRDTLQNNGFVPIRTNEENWNYKQKLIEQCNMDGYVFGSVVTSRDPSKIRRA